MIEADTEAPHGDRGLCKGDLIDLSLNKLKCGLPGSFTRSVRKPFPNPGFHQRLVQIEAGWFVKHPLWAAVGAQVLAPPFLASRTKKP